MSSQPYSRSCSVCGEVWIEQIGVTMKEHHCDLVVLGHQMPKWKARAEAAEAALAKSEESRQKLFSALQELKMQEHIAEVVKHGGQISLRVPNQDHFDMSKYVGTKLYAAPVSERVCRYIVEKAGVYSWVHTGCEEDYYKPESDIGNYCPNCGGKVEVSDE